MKRLRLLPLILALLLCGCAAKEGAPDPVPEESPAVREEAPAEQADFLSITGLDRMAEALEAGETLIGARRTVERAARRRARRGDRGIRHRLVPLHRLPALRRERLYRAL